MRREHSRPRVILTASASLAGLGRASLRSAVPPVAARLQQEERVRFGDMRQATSARRRAQCGGPAQPEKGIFDACTTGGSATELSEGV